MPFPSNFPATSWLWRLSTVDLAAKQADSTMKHKPIGASIGHPNASIYSSLNTLFS
jgi:hypothetical protein